MWIWCAYQNLDPLTTNQSLRNIKDTIILLTVLYYLVLLKCIYSQFQFPIECLRYIFFGCGR